MVQQLKDLAVKVKSDRRMWLYVGIGVIVLAVTFLAPGPRKSPSRQQSVRVEPQAPKLAANEAYSDIVERFSADLNRLSSETQKSQEAIVKTNQALDDYQQRTAEIFKKMLEKMADGNQQQTAVSALPMPESQPISNDLTPQELESFGMEQMNIEAPPEPAPEKVAVIGAGDSVRVELLAGVNAPTDGTPYPVVFKLVDAVNGPDGSNLPLGEARLIAASQGSITDSRALFRLTSLNVAMPDGSRKELKVDGWVVGEDGIRGLSGILIDPLGKALLGAGIAAGVQGFGAGLETQNSTTSTNFLGISSTQITGSPLEYAAGSAIKGVGREYSGIIRDRLAEMVPVVQVYSGRQATAVFSKSVTIPGLFEQLEQDESDFIFE